MALSQAPWHLREPLPIPGHDITVVDAAGNFVAAVRTRADAEAIAALPQLHSQASPADSFPTFTPVSGAVLGPKLPINPLTFECLSLTTEGHTRIHMIGHTYTVRESLDEVAVALASWQRAR